MAVKIIDNLHDSGSKLDSYWRMNEMAEFFREFRPGMSIAKDLPHIASSVDRVTTEFNLEGIQFGEWLNQVDRYNYLASLSACLYDLNTILRFNKNNIGFKVLGVSFGARGKSSALAHFEPTTEIINLTRYMRNDRLKEIMSDNGRLPFDTPKEFRFVQTGGPGSFAHEYGHFLDFYFGNTIEKHPIYNWLCGPDGSYKKQIVQYKSQYVLHKKMEEILKQLYFKNGKEGDPSEYILRLEKTYNNKAFESYLHYLKERAEMFARAFEKFVNYELTNKGMRNKFLTKSKYDKVNYISTAEYLRIRPLFWDLIKEMRKFT